MWIGLLRKVLLVAAVAFVTPVWAHGAHGPGRGHGAPHHGWNDHRHFDGRHHPHYAYGWRSPYPVYYGPRYYAYGYYAPGYYYPPYPPYPPYGYAVARPGIQITGPNIYIPLR
jgi:hypothetical protein